MCQLPWEQPNFFNHQIGRWRKAQTKPAPSISRAQGYSFSFQALGLGGCGCDPPMCGAAIPLLSTGGFACPGKGYCKIGRGHEVQPWHFAPDTANHSFLLVSNRQLLKSSCSAMSSSMRRDGDEAGGNGCSGAAGQLCCTGTCSCSRFPLVVALLCWELVWFPTAAAGNQPLLCFVSDLQEHLGDIGSV